MSTVDGFEELDEKCINPALTHRNAKQEQRQ